MEFIDENKYKKEIGIYAIKNIINKKVYVGQTLQNFQRRYWHHNWKLKNNTHDNIHLQNSWNKYGENAFVFLVLEITDDVDAREQYWINYYAKMELSYNIASGGGGKKNVPMPESAKKIVGEKNRAHNLGKKASQETKNKMSNTRKGVRIPKKTDVLSDDLVIKIKKQLIAGNTPSLISKDLNIPYPVISNINTDNSYKTVFVDGWNEYQQNRPIRKRSPNYTQSEIDDILRLYDNGLTYVEIARIYDTSRTRIRKCVLKNKKIS